MAGIQLGSGFDLNSPIPLDSRTQVDTTALRDAIPVGNRYEGLVVYVKEGGKYFSLTGGVANTNWKEMPTAEALAQINTALATTVKRVNGVAPSADGNVTIQVSGEIDTTNLATKAELQTKADVTTVQTISTQLASTVKKVNGVTPSADGNVVINVPEVDTSTLATKTELQTKANATDVQAITNQLTDKASTQDVEAVVERLEDISVPNTRDAVGEWWIHPVATFQSSPYPRTVIGAVASDGKILAIEYNHATLKKTRYEVGQSIIDDHNCPALWVKDGHRPVIVWTNHNDDMYLRFKVGSLNGDLGSLATAQEHSHLTTVQTSYTQLHYIEHLSTDTNDAFMLIYRSNNTDWRRLYLSVDQLTGQVNVTGSNGATLVSSPSRQCYVTTADAHNSNGNQVIRMAWGYNPAQATHAIYYIELDLVTGAITSPYHPALNANLDGTNLPIVDTAITPMIPETGAGKSRRLFYTRPGPDFHAVAYADWTIGDEDNAIYKVSSSKFYPVSQGGLVSIAGTGYLQSLETTEFNPQLLSGYEATVFAKFDGQPASNAELMRKYTSTAGGGTFYFRIKPDGKMIANIMRNGSGIIYDATLAVPGNWTDLRGFRFKVDKATNKIYFSYCLDGSTWVELENKDVQGTTDFTTSSESLVIGTTTTTNVSVPALVTSATLKTVDGTLLAGFDNISTAVKTGTTLTDSANKTWNIVGGATVNSTIPAYNELITHEFGIAGSRVGYTPEANYLPGMSFENPSYDGTVITAHTNNTRETLKKWRKTGDTYIAETLLDSETSKGRIVRPYTPVNNGPIPAVATKMTSYNHYNDYNGDIITT